MAKALDWIKAHYDRVALIAAAIFLFISAIWIWWSAIQFGNRLIRAAGARSAKSCLAPPASR
jgi:hypothetical protein